MLIEKSKNNIEYHSIPLRGKHLCLGRNKSYGGKKPKSIMKKSVFSMQSGEGWYVTLQLALVLWQRETRATGASPMLSKHLPSLL